MFATLIYHQLITDFFRRQPSTWRFFANHTRKEEQLAAFKTNLLKNTYKFDPAAETALYEKLATAKERLELPLPVTLYQALHTEDTNASIIYTGGEAHIVFSGKIIQLLGEEELLALIGHELGHVHLYRQLDGDLETADRIVTAIANHPGASPAQYESARLFQLYTEIFCDRCAAIAAGHYAPVVSAQVKTATGLPAVNADSYIKQAEEIFAHDNALRTTGITHPETFIRARAIYLWHSKADHAEDSIRRMIEGHTGLDELDLLRQEKLTDITRRLLQTILHPSWIQTAPLVALAKQYFGALEWTEKPAADALAADIGPLHETVKEYLSYVLYDMATADRQLEDIPLGYCFFLAGTLSLGGPFGDVVKKERKLTDKKAKALRQQAMTEYENSSEFGSSEFGVRGSGVPKFGVRS